MYESGRDAAECDSTDSGAAVSKPDAHGGGAATQGSVVQRLSRYVSVPTALQRRSRLQRQQEVSAGPAPGAPHRDSPPEWPPPLSGAMRKKSRKEFLCGALPAESRSASSPEQDADSWLLEHEWMLSAVDGNYDTILEFIARDRDALTKTDFISGYSVLHWLAKRGQDETLIRLLRHAETQRVPVDVNLRGSGGLTPLHVACMQGHYMVIKLLVGAFGADVDAMDYSGRRAWQYLRGDAPLEMKELLGAWDDEHRCGRALNANNNSNGPGAGTGAGAGVASVTPCDEVDAARTDEVTSFDRTMRAGSSRLKKLMPTFSFLRNKN